MQDSPDARRALTVSGYAVAVWSVLYMLPHVYLALGGTRGLTMFKPGIAQLPQLREINAWASLILGVAALLGLGLTRPSLRARVTWLWSFVTWFGCSIATAHGLVGIAVRSRMVLAASVEQAPLIGWVWYDLLLFEPWFLIEGLLLGTAGWYLMRDRAAKRRWLLACVAGVALGIVTAALRVKIW
jgi:hypothetical protein